MTKEKEVNRARLAAKLLRTKSYIVVLDEESFMGLNLKDPMQLTDLLTLSEQRASLDMLANQLMQVTKLFDKRLASFKPKQSKRTKKPTTKKA